MVERLPLRKLILAIVAALVALRFPLLGLLLLAGGIATRIPSRLSWAQRLIIGLLVTLVGNALLYQLFAMGSVAPPITLVGLSYAALGATLLVRAQGVKKASPWITTLDIAALAVFIIAIATLVYPVVVKAPESRETRAETTLRLMLAGEDNASHYALFKYHYQQNSYAYGQQENNTGLITSLVNYPQASEFTMAWLAQSVLASQHHANDATLVKAYYGLASIYFAFLLALVVLLAGHTYLRLRRRTAITATGGTALVSLAGLLLISGPLLSLVGRGFHSQIAAYICFISLLYIITVGGSALSNRMRFGIGTMLLAGVSINWWFLLPVATVPLVHFWWKHRKALRLNTKEKALLIALVISGVYPIVLSLLTLHKGSGALTEEGGIEIIAWVTVALYILGTLSFAFLSKKYRALAQYLLSTFIAAIGFTITIGLYQEHTVGHVTYYFHKSLYLFIPLCFIALATLMLHVVDVFSRTLSYAQRVLLGCMIPLLAITCLIALNPLYPRLYVNRWFNTPLPAGELHPMFDQAVRTQYQDTLFIGGCSPGMAYLSNRWSDAMELAEDRWRWKFHQAVLAGNNAEITAYLEQHAPPQNRFFVYGIRPCLDPELERYIIQKGYTTNLRP